MALFGIERLDDRPSLAVAQFHAQYLPQIAVILGQGDGALTLTFPPADHTHRAWRLAAVQSLAREYAPIRVNAICGGSDAARAAAIAYLDRADGLTGQYLPLDDAGAGVVIA
ncbi:MAG TPA: hypothetical protein PK680_11210 [Novosphingobium sp.]|nr:hypothetical protein [Novosphingobium sp.]HQA18938.1 hypothetical protein [Novosphingobium sp.]